MILNIVVITFMLMGLFFYVGGTVGILRLPDFYTRLHAAGKLDTLGALAMLFGLALFNLHEFNIDTLQVALKIMLAVAFVFIASPTATHAITDAGLVGGLPPWRKHARAGLFSPAAYREPKKRKER
ncbi:sodium:proton antiporter [Oceanidesulfovibrio indonesiensis]|uniref:Sodium:proton antiporter n=1 Tax=Oceanidesulfovibrio indonesiensis TaxID=54767 RepID=A0A7M3MGL5_9BACT|nr:monovalent cation/H(+) antiporter subunit G [Oceanidesulfovibrio indonesiensis]TVM18456.1 sodium:proton antiporter [Oceanidesulfovibrio indonesiensis]